MRRITRAAAWTTCAAVALGLAASTLRARARADLALGRERLLARDTTAAGAAYVRAARWPGADPAARAGLELVSAQAGRDTGSLPDPGAQAGVSVEALLVAALGEGRLDSAAALARLMRRAGDPLGVLYDAAIALETGDEPNARTTAAVSLVSLAARGPGQRLARALAARDAGAHTLLLDRRGELVATAGPDGGLQLADEATGLVPGLLERLPRAPAVPALRLAVDLDLSRAALLALGTERGSIVIVDARSGAVRAAVSDARTLARESAAAFAQRREPASIAKVLTAAAAYRNGDDPDAEIAQMACAGVERYGGETLWCPYQGGALAGLDDALAQSCNIAFANLGVRLGTERMRDEYRRWGFDQDETALLGGAGRVHTSPRTERQLADLAVGLELVDVTPLHAALLAAVVANRGRMPEPRLVTGTTGPLGLVAAEDPPPPGREVIAPEVARRLSRAMDAVARYGTAAALAPPGFPVAMKTGTAAEYRKGYHVNYIGFGPLHDPRLAFCVRVTHRPSSPAVTRAARDVTRRLLALLSERGQVLGLGVPQPPEAAS